MTKDLRSLIAVGKRFRAVVVFGFEDKDLATFKTVEHGPAPTPVRELTWSVDTYRPHPGWELDGWDRPTSVEALYDQAENVRLVNGWTKQAAEELFAIGDRWHLNAMNAGCAHMVPAPVGTKGLGFEIGALDNPEPRPLRVEVSGRVGLVTGGPVATLSHYTVNRALACPITGYRYGSAWLVEPLPHAIERRVREILSRHPEAFEPR